MNNSGKSHGIKCEKLAAGPTAYVQNTEQVAESNGLSVWNKAQLDSGLGSSRNYKKTTKGDNVTISGREAEISELYSNINGGKLPESETDTYVATGKSIRFVNSSNKILAVWSEVSYNGPEDEGPTYFYILTLSSDETKYSKVLVRAV
jgi:hypothetical protein